MNRWTAACLTIGMGFAALLPAAPVAAAQQTGAAAPPPPPAAETPRVNLDLRDAPVRAALEQLFRQVKADFSMANDVDGFVTLKLTDQPFENALRLLLRARGNLTYEKTDGVYFIRRRQVAAAEPARPAATAAADDRTTVAAAASSWETIALTYLDPADVAGLLNVTLLQTFTRAGAGSAAGRGQGASARGTAGNNGQPGSVGGLFFVGGRPGAGGPGGGSVSGAGGAAAPGGNIAIDGVAITPATSQTDGSGIWL